MFRTRTSEPSDPGPHAPASRRFRSFARRALPLATTTLCARHRHRDRPHQCLKGRFAHGSRTRSFRNREALSLRSFDEQPHPFVIERGDFRATVQFLHPQFRPWRVCGKHHDVRSGEATNIGHYGSL